MADAWTLKVEFEDDMRRFRLVMKDEESPATKICDIHKAILNGFGLSDSDGPLTLKYKDEDGDACTLVEATIEDFLDQPRAKPLRLRATKPSRPVSNAADAALAPKTVEAPLPQALSLPKPCPSNCGYQVTWHRTHCCGQCSGKPGKHGGRCDRLLIGQKADASGFSQDPPHPATSSWSCNLEGSNSAGPRKLLMCLRNLHDAGMMTSKMVASMMLQFLPILAQRAHRKQEKLNKVGAQKLEVLRPLLLNISAHLDLVEEARLLKPMLEEFLSGADVCRFGDFVAALFKALTTCKNRQAVSEAIQGVADDLQLTLPQLFPDLFDSTSTERGPGVPEHFGISCSGCSVNPIRGPRFHCAEASIDFCGDCFIVQSCKTAEQQFQCIFTHEEPQGSSQEQRLAAGWRQRSWQENGFDVGWREKMKAWEDYKSAWWKDRQAEFKECAAKKGWFGKGKGKSKGKGKGGKGKGKGCSSTVLDVAESGDSAPPGLDLPSPFDMPSPFEGFGPPLPLESAVWSWGSESWPRNAYWEHYDNTSAQHSPFEGLD